MAERSCPKLKSSNSVKSDMTQAEHQPAVGFKEGYLDVDGFRIRYTEAGEGNQVVLLEGATWGMSMLRNALSQNYRVVSIELPGFGHSAANTKSQSAQELADTAIRVVHQLVAGHYTLIGTSFAANVALWQALQSPKIVEGLVLISPTAILPNEIEATINPQDRCLQLLAHPENAAALTAIDPTIWAKEEELVRRLNGHTYDVRAEARLSEVRSPTLVVFGVKDKTVAPEAARIYREKIPNSNISFVYDAGHLIEAERPEALIDAVSSYVEHRETYIVGRENHLINP